MERVKLKKKLLNKKEPVFNNWGNSQPFQIAIDATIQRFTIRKVCSGEKVKNVADTLCANAEEAGRMPHGSLQPSQPSQQKAGTGMGLHRKYLRRTLLSNRINIYDIHWRATTLF